MRFGFWSLRNQLLISFLSFPLLLIILFLINEGYLTYVNDQRNTTANFRNVQVLTNKMVYHQVLFLQSERDNEQFHKTGENSFLTDYKYYLHLLEDEINMLINDDNSAKFGLKDSIIHLKCHIFELDSIFKRIVEKVKIRGFKDYGLVGEMRDYAHYLEDEDLIDKALLLTLRRNEKDYLLRNDTVYAKSFNRNVRLILNSLKNSNSVNDTAISSLIAYKDLFNELVIIREEIGPTNQQGLKKIYNSNIDHIDNLLGSIITQTNNEALQIEKKVSLSYLIGFILFVLFSILLSYYHANIRSRPIQELTNEIKEATKKEAIIMDINSSRKLASKELRSLVESFNKLLEKINKQVSIIANTSKELKKQNNELKKVNNELDNFVYSVSHDLRAPLASLLGLVNLAKNEKDPAMLGEYWKLQEKSINKLDSFIRNIINLSRNARQTLHIQAVDFDKLCSEIVASYRFDKKNKNIELIYNIHNNTPFYSDYHRIQIILSNLISNAYKYHDPQKGNPQIRLDCNINENEAEIRVWDNGIGIESDYLDKIFEMFWRGSDRSDGTGIGLYIVRDTILKLNGLIEVNSKTNEFTEFKLRIPNNPNHVSDTVIEKESIHSEQKI